MRLFARLRYGCTLLIIAVPSILGLRAEAQPDARAPIVVLRDSTASLDIGPFVEILEDPTHKLSIDMVRAAEGADSAKADGGWKKGAEGHPGVFVRGGTGVPNFGYSNSAFWVRVRFQNESTADQWYVEAAYAPLDHVDLYKPGATKPLQAGDQVPLSDAPPEIIRHTKPAFRISIPRGTSSVYYMRVVTAGSVIVPISIHEPAEFSAAAVRHTMLMWGFIGFMVSLQMYNLFLWIGLRDSSYLYLAASGLGAAIFFAAFDGTARLLLWPDSSFLANAGLLLSVFFTMTANVKFSDVFLDLRSHSPRLRFLANLIAGVGATFFVTAPFIPYAISVRASSLMAVIMFPFLLVIGVVCLRNGFRPAKYYLLAWSVLIGFVFLLPLRAFGIIPDNFLTANGSLFGAAMVGILLSLGLADRINVLSRQRSEAEGEAANLRDQLKAKQKMAVIGDMAAGIVHDLKNPVAVIKGYIEMADDADLGRENRQMFLRIVDQEADRMLDMVQDLLEFSRGSIAVEKKPVQVLEYLERVQRTIQPNFDAKGIRVTVGAELTGTIELDPDRFLRAIVNIASNAADALPKGGKFEIKLREHRAGKERQIILDLTDDGPGIPEPIRANLFDPFVTHGKSHGTGLGMAITKSLVEAHGGSISFVSAAGLGTTFTILLPLGAAKA